MSEAELKLDAAALNAFLVRAFPDVGAALPVVVEAEPGRALLRQAFAAATAPAVQEHLNMAEGLKNGFDTGKDVAKAQVKADKAQAKADEKAAPKN